MNCGLATPREGSCASEGGEASTLGRVQTGELSDDLTTGSCPVTDLADSQLGKYRLQRLLGRGGFGAVYLAEDISSAQRVALKVMTPGSTEDVKSVLRFQRESWTGAKLNHANIVRVLDTGFAEGLYYIVMEYVEGETARSLAARQGGRLNVRLAMSIARHCLLALREAHGHGIIHRDVKPSNILLTQDLKTKLADFSLAKPLDQSWNVTEQGVIVGTPMFMSPEQALAKPQGPPSDIFSLGATLYFLLSGSAPYFGRSRREVVEARLSVVPVPVHQLRRDVPASLAEFVARMMRIAPEERFASADEALLGLSHAMKIMVAASSPSRRSALASGASAPAARMTVCPRCMIGFKAPQSAEYTCPRHECGHKWGAHSATDRDALLAEGRQAQPEVLILTGRCAGDEHRIEEGRTRIGSMHDAEVFLPDPQLEPEHLRIERSGENVVAVAASEKAAFYLNGDVADSPAAIESGDRILLGRTLLEYRVRFVGRGVSTRSRQRDLKEGLRQRLEVLLDGKPAREIRLDSGRLTVGRAEDRNIRLNHEHVSRKHAVLLKQADGFYTLDARSSGGTFVNDEPVICRKLNPGDIVQIGPFAFVFTGDALLHTLAD